VLEAVRQKRTTHDVGGRLGTQEAAQWVISRLESS